MIYSLYGRQKINLSHRGSNHLYEEIITLELILTIDKNAKNVKADGF